MAIPNSTTPCDVPAPASAVAWVQESNGTGYWSTSKDDLDQALEEGAVALPVERDDVYEYAVRGVTGTASQADLMRLATDVVELQEDFRKLRHALRAAGPLLKVAGETLRQL